MITINGFVDKVFWINLDARRDRAANMVKRLEALGIKAERFPAKTYRTGQPLPIKVERCRGINRAFNAGEIGCLLSHFAIWEKMVDEGIDKALILEDDAFFVSDFQQRINAELPLLPSDWDTVYLGRSFYDPSGMWPTAFMMPYNGSDSVFEAKENWLTHAYALTKETAKYYLDNIKIMDYPIDGLMAELQGPLKSFAFYPNLAIQDGTKSNLR